MLINETHLKPCFKDPRMAHYSLIRHDRTGSPMGGTLIYYKRSLHCIPLPVPPLSTLEASCCKISMTGHQPIVIASCYLSGNRTFIRNDFEELLSLGNSVILAGDFNAKLLDWGNNTTNPHGPKLQQIIEDFNLDLVSPVAPTCFPDNLNHRSDVLDIAIFKGITLKLRSLEVLHELDSDHRPVLAHLGADPNSNPPPRTKSVVNWKKLGETLNSISSPDLDKIPDDIVTRDDVNRSIDALTSHLRTAVDAASRQVPAETHERWRLPDDARDLIRKKNAALRAFDWCRTEERRVTLRYYERAVRKRIKELRAQRWDDLLSEISPTHQAYWKLARALKSDTVAPMPPLDRPGLQPAFEDDEKAECLAASLESQCSPSLNLLDSDHLEEVERELEERASTPLSEDPIPPVSTSEVALIIKGLRPRKAPGADGISNQVLKHFSPPLVHLLVSIFNAALTNHMFPEAWKSADVIGIHKPGKPASEPSNYRPISLLSSLGKIYERILLKRLWFHINENNILPEEQFGFRARHSCVQQVHRITEYILEGFNTGAAGYTVKPKSKCTIAVFLDVAKAFDKVWHDGLVYKLYHLGFPDRLVLIVQDFLQARSFRYKVHGERSTPRPIKAGVPQGSALSPVLFSIYTSDIPHTPNVELALFADDTALYSRGWKMNIQRSHVQRALNTLGDWFRKWAITVNPEKSAAVCFHPSRRKTPVTPLKLNGKPIPWVKSTKYLGVTLDSKLTFSQHIKNVRNRARFFLSRLRHLLCAKSKMALRNKVTLYKTCIRPVMTYASVAFAQASPRDIDSLQVVQNRFIRRAVDAPWYARNADLHCDLVLPSIAQWMKHTSRRYFDRVAHHPNSLLVQATTYSINTDPPVPLRRRPRHVLDDPDDVIAVATSAAFGSPSPIGTNRPNNRFAVFGTGPGYQIQHSNKNRFRPRRRGRGGTGPIRSPNWTLQVRQVPT